jgi:hypothetical protein
MTPDLRRREREGYEMAASIVGRQVVDHRSMLRGAGIAEDDARQAAWVVVMEACDRVDDTADQAARGAFVRDRVAGCLVDLVRHARRHKRGGTQLHLDLHTVTETGAVLADVIADDRAPDLDDTIDAARLLPLACAAFVRQASKDERHRQIALRFAHDDESQAELARRLKTSQQRISIVERRMVARAAEAARQAA